MCKIFQFNVGVCCIKASINSTNHHVNTDGVSVPGCNTTEYRYKFGGGGVNTYAKHCKSVSIKLKGALIK